MVLKKVSREKEAYEWLQERLTDTFELLYTKAKMVRPNLKLFDSRRSLRYFWALAANFWMACSILPFAAIGLFHKSHREADNDQAVKVTYTLLSCTAALEFLSFHRDSLFVRDFGSRLSGTVFQCGLMGFFALKEKYVTSVFIQHRGMPRNSSSRITLLVLKHVKYLWKQHVQDGSDYRSFNNHRGQWTVQEAGCGILGWSMNRPFDESVLLWHIATDLCFYRKGASPDHACSSSLASNAKCPAWCTKSVHHIRATGCREISNYMMYLLFTKPEMLMAGTRRNLFIAAYNEIPKGQEQPPWKQRVLGLLTGLGRFLYCCVNSKEEKEQQLLEERSVAQRIFAKMERSPAEGLVQDAWILADGLLELDKKKKMWKVIEGVWVEMLCYSASRCRGYLHAKSLGTGGELLTFVWLLWSHMGMETLADRMQTPDAELARAGGNAGAAQLGGLLVDAGSSQVDAIVEDGGGV